MISPAEFVQRTVDFKALDDATRTVNQHEAVRKAVDLYVGEIERFWHNHGENRENEAALCHRDERRRSVCIRRSTSDYCSARFRPLGSPSTLSFPLPGMNSARLRPLESDLSFTSERVEQRPWDIRSQGLCVYRLLGNRSYFHASMIFFADSVYWNNASRFFARSAVRCAPRSLRSMR